MNNMKKEAAITITEEHKYNIESILIKSSDGESIGTLKLLNVCSNEIEEYSIWIGDDDYSWFYVCLPTGDEDELSEVYNIDIFGIQLGSYASLNW